MGGVGGERAGDAVVEAHAEGEQEVGLLDGLVDPGLAVHAHHAEGERMAGGEGAEAEQRAGDGDLAALGEGEELGFGLGDEDAVAGEDDWTLGRGDEFGGLLDGAGFGAQHGMGAMRGGRGGGEVEGRGGLLRVFRYIDEHRAGTAGGGDLEGGADGGGDVFRATDEEVVLGDGQGDAGDVDLLEGVGAEDLGGDLAGDADDGDGVQHGGGDAGDEVGGPGAAGGDGDADAAGCARVSVGHVGRALLVADQDVVDGKLAQRIVGGKDGPAGIAEDGGYALADEGCPDDFGPGEGGDVFALRFVCHRGLLMLRC